MDASGISRAFDGVAKAFFGLIVWGLVMGVLGIWKLVEIVIWIVQHVRLEVS